MITNDWLSQTNESQPRQGDDESHILESRASVSFMYGAVSRGLLCGEIKETDAGIGARPSSWSMAIIALLQVASVTPFAPLLSRYR